MARFHRITPISWVNLEHISYYSVTWEGQEIERLQFWLQGQSLSQDGQEIQGKEAQDLHEMLQKLSGEAHWRAMVDGATPMPRSSEEEAGVTVGS